MKHQYTEQNLRAASPEKCKHPVGGEWKGERSYGRTYQWMVCPLCGAEFNHTSYDW